MLGPWPEHWVNVNSKRVAGELRPVARWEEALLLRVVSREVAGALCAAGCCAWLEGCRLIDSSSYRERAFTSPACLLPLLWSAFS